MKRMLPVGVLIVIGMAAAVMFTCARQKPLRATNVTETQTAQETATHPPVDFSMGCVECHTTMTPAVVRTWEGSLHGEANVKCYVCHGDGQQEFHAAGDATGCTGCHSDQSVDFVSRPENSCFDCHNGHTLAFHTGS